jgi:GntR family transcriptional regulator / MocR family aminotransferase
LVQQVCSEIRRLILEGEWPAGKKLPSERELAETLAVSRPTITQAFDQLSSEGYLESYSGSGTFVTRRLDESALAAWRAKDAHLPEVAPDMVTPLAGKLLEQLIPQAEPASVSFLDRQIFVPQELRRALEKAVVANLKNASIAELGYQTDARGLERLRAMLAEYLLRARHVQCSSQDILTVTGTSQALNIICKLYVNPGDRVIMENPGFQLARQIFETNGAKVDVLPVDEHGLKTEALENASKDRLKLVYVTPSHQMPLGSVLSLERRLALLSDAYKTGYLIVEDDFNGDFRYEGRMVPSLQGIDNQGAVIYLGSFSKALFPGLRLSYMVVPHQHVHAYRQCKRLMDTHSSFLEQAAVADLMESGGFEKHIHRMKQLYDARRKLLIEQLKNAFGDRVSVLGESAGLHVIARLDIGMTDDEFIARAAAADVAIETTARHYVGEHPRGEFILSYSAADEEQIVEGIAKLKSLV